MNEKVYALLIKILDSDLPKEDKSEIVRFYTLPRNTPVKPILEQEEIPEDVGPVKQPSAEDIAARNDPERADKEAVAQTLKGRINGG